MKSLFLNLKKLVSFVLLIGVLIVGFIIYNCTNTTNIITTSYHQGLNGNNLIGSYDSNVYLPYNILQDFYNFKENYKDNEDIVFNENEGYIEIKRNQKILKISNMDIINACSIIYYESLLEPFEGKVAVGNVVLNRAFNQHKNLTQIIYQKGQFQPVLEGKMKELKTNEECIKAFFTSLTQEDKESRYFLNPTISESDWIIKNCKFVKIIGHHHFYKDNIQ